MTESLNWGDLMGQVGAQLQPIPPGDYPIIVHSTEFKMSTTGKPMWKMTLKVQGGQHDGRNVWTQQVLTAGNPNALTMFFRQMGALGLNEAFFRSLPPGDAGNQKIAEALLGRTAIATLKIKKYNGEDRNEVGGYKPMVAGAGGTFSPPPSTPPPAPAAQVPPPATPPPAPATAAPQAPAAPPAPAPAATPPAPAPAAAPPPPAPAPPPAAPVPPAPVPEVPAAPPVAPAPAPAPAPEQPAAPEAPLAAPAPEQSAAPAAPAAPAPGAPPVVPF